MAKKKKIKKLTKEEVGKIKEPVKKTKIRVIGIGGGGGSIVSEIAQKLANVSFVAANTDLQALKKVRKGVFPFQFGQNFTQGLGTGMNPELAREAALNEKERIKKLFSGYDFCILIASLGAGTGSGASPIFAQIAKSVSLITLGIFTLPFKFEGEKKMELAKDALQKLRPNLNTLIILPNERIFQVIDKNTPLKEALSAINKDLAENLTGLIETIYLPGLINIDFADLKTILEGQGKLAFLNTILIEREKGGAEALKKVINSPLYSYSISGAKGILLNFAGQKNLSLSEVSQISKSISELVNPEAKIIFGISQGREKYQDKIKVTLLATGCASKIFSEKTTATEKKKIKKLTKKLPSVEIPKPPVLEKKTKKRKVKIRKKIKEKPKIKVKISPPVKESPLLPTEEKPQVPVRKNALQIKKEAEEAEKEILEKEAIWETPAFLRKSS